MLSLIRAPFSRFPDLSFSFRSRRAPERKSSSSEPSSVLQRRFGSGGLCGSVSAGTLRDLFLVVGSVFVLPSLSQLCLAAAWSRSAFERASAVPDTGVTTSQAVSVSPAPMYQALRVSASYVRSLPERRCTAYFSLRMQGLLTVSLRRLADGYIGVAAEKKDATDCTLLMHWRNVTASCVGDPNHRCASPLTIGSIIRFPSTGYNRTPVPLCALPKLLPSTLISLCFP